MHKGTKKKIRHCFLLFQVFTLQETLLFHWLSIEANIQDYYVNQIHRNAAALTLHNLHMGPNAAQKI